MPKDFAAKIAYQEDQVEKMAQFEKEIVEMSEVANAQIEEILKRLAEAMFDEDKKDGLLRQHYSKYANCFKIDLGELRNQLTFDVKTWATELVEIKADV